MIQLFMAQLPTLQRSLQDKGQLADDNLISSTFDSLRSNTHDSKVPDLNLDNRPLKIHTSRENETSRREQTTSDKVRSIHKMQTVSVKKRWVRDKRKTFEH